MDLERLGETIKALRRRHGLTQSQLAGEELTKGYISQIEHGRIAPSIRTLGLLAGRLGCTLPDLVGPGLAGDVLDEAESAFMEGDLTSAWSRLEQLAGTREVIPLYLVLASEVGARLGKEGTPVLIERALGEGTLSATERARVLNAWGIYLASKGKSREALDRFEEARGILQAGTADIPLRLRVLSNCGNFQARLGNYRPALDRLYECLDLSRRAGLHLSLGSIHATLGFIYRRLGEPAQAEEYHRRALFYARAEGDPDMTGTSLHNLGLVYREMGRLQEAEEHLRQALDLFGKGHAQRPNTLFELAQVLAAQERMADAFTVLDEVQTARLEPADKPRYPLLLARCHRALGRSEQALETLRLASAVLQPAPPDLQVEAAKEEAFALMELGRVQEAQEAVNRSMELMGRASAAGGLA